MNTAISPAIKPIQKKLAQLLGFSLLIFIPLIEALSAATAISKLSSPLGNSSAFLPSQANEPLMITLSSFFIFKGYAMRAVSANAAGKRHV